MIAVINSIVAGVGVTLLAGELLQADQTVVASLLGVGVAGAAMVAFVHYERWRFRVFELAEPHGGPQDGQR